MATLTIADLDNGKRDLQTVDAVANSRAATATTRHGQQTTTLYEAIRRIITEGDAQLAEQKESAETVIRNLGFMVPVPYAPGIEVTESNFTVIGPDGNIYAAQAGQIPFTTGAWDPSQWYVLQNDLNDHKLLVFDTLVAAEAAAATLPDGQVVVSDSDEVRGVVNAGVIDQEQSVYKVADYAKVRGYTGRGTRLRVVDPTGAHWWVRSGSSADNGGTVLVDALGRSWEREYSGAINVKWFGAVGNGVADDDPAFQLIYNTAAAGATMRCTVPPGTYRLATSPIIGDGCVIWEFDPGAVISGPGTLPYTSPPINKGKRVNTGQPLAPFQGGIQRFDSPLVMGDTAHAFFSSGYLGPITFDEDAVLFGAYAVDSVDHPRTWTQNINIVKQTSGSAITQNYACGIEISVQNQTNVVGAPNADECLMGLFASYIKSTAGSDKASAAIVVAGDGATATQGWQNGVWIDNIVANGVGIRIGNTHGGQAMGAAIDTRGHSGPFLGAAILLGNSHRIVGNDPGGSPRQIMNLDGSNYLQIGDLGIAGGTVINTQALLLPNIQTQTTATSGAATLPANPAGFITVAIAGTNRKIPFYAV